MSIRTTSTSTTGSRPRLPPPGKARRLRRLFDVGAWFKGLEGAVEIDNPVLPTGIDRLNVTNLQVGDGLVDLAFQQLRGQTVVVPARRAGRVSVRSLA